MKHLPLLLIFTLSLTANIFAQDLPKFMTAEEQKIYKNYVPPIGETDDINPPVSPVRTMAEWEEFQGVLITWTSYTGILSQMVKYIQQECYVYIVCSDSNSVKNTLTSNGVPLINLKFLKTSFNSVWCRDYGQWCVYTNDVDTMRFIDWIYNRPRPQDDQIPVFLANYMNVPLHQTTTSPNNITATGGNFMVDGNHTGFSSKLILNENSGKTEAQIDTIYRKYMGIRRYIKMNTLPYDGIHHIDMHMKLLDEETLMVGQYPTGIADGPQIEINLQYVLSNFQTCYGRPYKIVRVPMPPSTSGQYPPNSNYYTYTNSLIVNKTVLVPIYNFSLDTTALRIYREAMPGYKVIGIDCNASIPASGAIHCISKEIGVNEPIFISHPSIRNAYTSMSNYEVKALIKTKSGVSSPKVFWTTDTLTGFSELAMTNTGSDTFRAYIPSQPLNSKVYYYIQANSVSGRSIKKPMTAPSGNYRFTVTNPTGITESGEPIAFGLSQNYPNPFNPVTSIEFQVPSLEFVKLVVYDMLGREVSVLVNENKLPGEYKVFFNGSGLSSGMYFYTLTAGSYTETRKMMLMK